MCITRSERVCDNDSIKREWLFIICVTFSLSNSPDIRWLCLKKCYLCFWFVFKILFSPIHCVLYFYFVPHCSTISMYYLYVHLYVYKYVYSWAYCPMYKEINCYITYIYKNNINTQLYLYPYTPIYTLHIHSTIDITRLTYSITRHIT